MSAKVFILSLFVSCTFLIGCSDDDETVPISSIAGEWNLFNISGGFAGTNTSFEHGTVIWNFNTDTNILSVENNLDEQDAADAIYETGDYNFQLDVREDIRILFIENARYGTIHILEDTLRINDGYADGYLLQFVR